MDLEDFYRVVRNGHVRAQGIVDTVPDPLLVLDRDLRIEAANCAFYVDFEVTEDETIGKLLYDLGIGQWDIPDLRRLLEDVIPKATAVIDYEVKHEFPHLGQRTMLLTARRLHHPAHASRTLLLSIVDATERRQREAEKDILLGELRHRMKNLLALVQAMARQTSTEGRSGAEYRDDFVGRFNALVRAHEFTFAVDTGVGLHRVIANTLEPYTSLSSALVIEPGAVAVLAAIQAQPLSLILHELATNAVKYGALSVRDGRVGIRWVIENGGVRLYWQESGGPSASPPVAIGFGTRLIQVAAAELDAHLELHYEPTGLIAEIIIPLRTSSEA